MIYTPAELKIVVNALKIHSDVVRELLARPMIRNQAYESVAKLQRDLEAVTQKTEAYMKIRRVK